MAGGVMALRFVGPQQLPTETDYGVAQLSNLTKCRSGVRSLNFSNPTSPAGGSMRRKRVPLVTSRERHRRLGNKSDGVANSLSDFISPLRPSLFPANMVRSSQRGL